MCVISLFIDKKNKALPSSLERMKEVKKLLVNQKQLAKILGISDRRIRQLKEEGMFCQEEGEKRYTLEKCVQEYIEYKEKAEMGKGGSRSKEEVQAEHEEIKKQISILKLRKLRRELHEAADVEMFLSDMLIRFKNRLLNVPEKLAISIAGETDINEVILIIEKEMFSVLEELSEYDPDAIDKELELEVKEEGEDEKEEEE